MSAAAYAVGHLRSVDMRAGIVEYLQRIGETLTPFCGTFLVHGGDPDIREGTWSGDLIVIGFPDMENAVAWYESPAYQQIVPLRADNSDGDIFLIEGVAAPHMATDVLA